MTTTSSSLLKAFLCSTDGTLNFPLNQRITTIGRENSDIVINNNSVDAQHAIIEYLEDEYCYILQDLNSVNGTYVNDTRVQNTAVKLVEQDSIRFGQNGTSFQFIIQSQFMNIPPINLSGLNRPQVQPLQLINQTLPSRGNRILSATQSSGAVPWVCTGPPNASLVTINNQFTKPPASLRSRPISAGVNNRINTKVNSWVKGYTNSTSSIANGTTNIEVPVIDSETYRQDDNDYGARIAQLEKELRIRTLEIKDLKEKVVFYQNQTNGNGHTELEQIKRDKSIAVGLVNTMQKDLSNKDATISKLAREIEGYKKEIKDKENLCKELEEKLNSYMNSEEQQNKEKELVVLRTKFKATENKIIDLTNQILQVKNELEESQRQSQKQAQAEKALRNEVEHAKEQFLDMQRAERTVRIDLEQSRRIYEKFRNLIIQTVYSTPDSNRPSGEITDDHLTAEWKKIVSEKTSLISQIESLTSAVNTHEKNTSERLQKIQSLEIFLNEMEDKLNAEGRRSSNLKIELEKLNELETDESLAKLKEKIACIYTNQINWQNQTEEVFKNTFEIDIENNSSNQALLLVLKSKIDEINSEKSAIEAKLLAADETSAKNLSEQLEIKQNEFNQKLKEFEAELNAKNSEKVEILVKEHQEFIQLIKTDFEQQKAQLTEENTNLLAKIEYLNLEISALNADLETIRSKDETELLRERLDSREKELSERISSLENELTEKENLRVQQTEELNLRISELNQTYNSELSAHREQIKQHSLTIVNFEKEITRLKKLEQDYLNQIDHLHIKMKESGIVQRKQTHTPKPEPPVEISSLNKTIELLRSECHTYKTRLTEQDELIKTLRRDLAGASAKLSDVHGEMTEKQKRELERNKQLVLDQQRELSDNRAQMAKLSEIVDKQTKQLESLKLELSKSKSLVEKYRVTSEENGQLAVELKSKLDGVEFQLQKYDTVKKEEGKITNELTAVGAQCKGERHEQVISRQREALNELRQRVKLLEQTRPAMPTHQQQMQQQIMLLKKQLAEVRASQALTDDIAKQANLTRGNDNSFLMLEEKTAHYETQSALDYSEESFLTMLRTLGSLLDINELDGLRSMANLPPDEKKLLNLERDRSIQTICYRIKSLQEKLDRKEELLKEYELDLAKLRQAEFLLQKKSEQLDSTQVYSRSKEDEIEYLKESLKNAKSELEREKLLNTAIKQKKSVNSVQQFTERVRRGSTETLHHHCPPVDHKHSQVKKTMNEKIKRKDYELKTLKDDLKNKTNELSALTSRLSIVENGQID